MRRGWDHDGRGLVVNWSLRQVSRQCSLIRHTVTECDAIIPTPYCRHIFSFFYWMSAIIPTPYCRHIFSFFYWMSAEIHVLHSMQYQKKWVMITISRYIDTFLSYQESHRLLLWKKDSRTTDNYNKGIKTESLKVPSTLPYQRVRFI